MSLDARPPAPPPSQLDVGGVVGAFVALIVQGVADELDRRQAARAAPMRWATARDNPLGSAFTFLAAGRWGEFEVFKVGRQVRARWDDVEAFIGRRKLERDPAPASPKEKRRAQRAAVGLKGK